MQGLCFKKAAIPAIQEFRLNESETLFAEWKFKF